MRLTERQAQVAMLVARGLSRDAIAREVGISPRTVARHIRDAAERVPGTGRPMHRLTLWFLSLADEGPHRP